MLLAEKSVNVQLLKEIIADIRRDDRRASDVIKYLRTLLQQRSETEVQTFDLKDAIDAAVRILGPEATKRGIALDTTHTNTAFPVRAYQVQLQQVILNLVANGMDAVSESQPSRRRLMVQAIPSGESDVEVLVSDSGAGIAKDALRRIFDTFYKTKATGTGLGLSIARTIVESYGGKIWAENREGGGGISLYAAADDHNKPGPLNALCCWAGRCSTIPAYPRGCLGFQAVLRRRQAPAAIERSASA